MRASGRKSLLLAFACEFSALVLALSACAPPAAIAVIDAIDPPRGHNDRAVSIVIVGRSLDPTVDEQGASVVATSWEGAVGGVALEDVRFVSSERIEAFVPIGLPAGAHDVTLRSATRELRLTAGFVAVAPTAPRLDAIEPGRVPPEGGVVTLTGVGLDFQGRVRIDGIEVPITWIDDRTLRIVLPSRESGLARIEVETPVGIAWRQDLLAYGER